MPIPTDWIRSLDDIELTPRVAGLRKAYFEATPEVCAERPLQLTGYHRDHHLFDQERITPLDKAHAYKDLFEQRVPKIFDFTYPVRRPGSGDRTWDYEERTVAERSLFAGSTTTKFKGVILYPELLALALWPELHTLPQRKANPYYLDAATRHALNTQVFPYWMADSVLERARRMSKPKEAGGPDFDLLEYLVFFLASKPNCISHTIPDFSRAVRDGLAARIAEARARRDEATEPEAQNFYEALAVAMEGIITYSTRLAEAAEAQAATEADPTVRQELEILAAIHRKVPARPARTFREGMTALWVLWTAVHQENANVGLSLGRIDQLLIDLYRQDREAGTLTEADAVELACCLWLKIGDHVPTVPQTGEQLFGGTGSNQAITIGGVDRQGRDAVNELTYIFLRATELMQLRDPNLTARYHPDVHSREYLERLCRANVRTGATPALHNDRAAIAALMAKGDAEEDARDYGVVGCVEPCSAGRHYGHSGALLVNLPSVLEMTLFGGKHRHTGAGPEGPQIGPKTPAPAEMTSFDEVWDAFETQARWMVAQTVAVNNALGRAHQAVYPTPILSSLFEGPMERGKDLIFGGAMGNSSGVAVIGLADVADSLTAIERVVAFPGVGGNGSAGDDGVGLRVRFEELVAALERDFEGPEDAPLLATLRNPERVPVFGLDDAQADQMVYRVAALLDSAWGAEQNYRGGTYRVGYWTMTNHAGFGRLMEATPSGRRAGKSFASGITPESGRTPELTAALHSVAGLPAAVVGNGMALNLKFTPADLDALAEDELVKRFADHVLGYMDPSTGSGGTGGLEIQFNVTDNCAFWDAREHPEKYPELLVRVSGYTAYFRDLNPQMQDEIIERTEYSLRTGKAVRIRTP